MKPCVGAGVLIAGLFSYTLPGRAAEPPLVEQFDKLRSLIKPQADEDKWAGIHWLTDLWDARQRAAAQGKPILLWEMDGHPLGCG